jgi:hypothetical protein
MSETDERLKALIAELRIHPVAKEASEEAADALDTLQRENARLKEMDAFKQREWDHAVRLVSRLSAPLTDEEKQFIRAWAEFGKNLDELYAILNDAVIARRAAGTT